MKYFFSENYHIQQFTKRIEIGIGIDKIVSIGRELQ